MAIVPSLVVLVAVALEAQGQSDVPNMNGEYFLSQTPHGQDTQARFPTHYKDYPGGVTHFDVYSPLVSTLYSQVFWKSLPPVSLPDEIVRRFDGKGMAVVGFELDQVRRTDAGDVAVPMSVTYNHHFETTMTGKHNVFEKVQLDGPNDPRIQHMNKMGHGAPSHKEMWMLRDLGTSDGSLPTATAFGGANGGEVRKSFHGYAPGFVQVIDSPTEVSITPMQIDTWNRDKMNVSHPTKFVPGPVPRSSLAPTEGPDAMYSGLLECPVTTRIRKDVQGIYAAQGEGACYQTIATAEECYAAAKKVLGGNDAKLTNSSGADTSKPLGCSAAADVSDMQLIHVYFRTASTEATARRVFGEAVACGAGTTRYAGSAKSLVHVAVELDSEKQVAKITLTGPSTKWFGVAFNATAMKDKPWAIIVDGSGKVTERQLADQNSGKELPSSVTVTDSTESGGLRTVVMTRPFSGPTSDYFAFDTAGAAAVLNFINAVGSGPAFAYHQDKRPSSLVLLPIATDAKVGGVCVCTNKPAAFGQGKGSLVYEQTNQSADTGSGTIAFGNTCPPQPRGDLLAMKNPTCDIRTYVGGQLACHHMFSLLDADQEIPWVDQPLEYHLKFRFWVQEYNASYHTQVKRHTWGIASPVEYDIPKCADGVMGCSKNETDGSWAHTITGTFGGSGKLVAAHFHCHAPGCLKIELYRCARGTTVCNATTGDLLCREEPIYGGTGRIPEPRFDEPGLILQPPCLWGSTEFGLEAPPDVGGYVLGAVKTSNATYGHHGEMAWLQMYRALESIVPDFLI